MLEREDFAAPVEGTITVQLDEATYSVWLPEGAAAIGGGNTLRLAWSTVAVDLTPEALRSILESAGGGQAEKVRIRLTAVKAPKAAVEQLINNPAANGSVQLSAASDVVSFSLEAVAADGTAVPVTTLDEPLMLAFSVDPNADPGLLGIYYIAGDGILEFVGGALKDGKWTAGIRHFSQYAVLEYDRVFEDVSTDLWASGAIKTLAAKHIIEGISAAEFNPHGEVTRAQFAAMLARTLGLEADSPSTFRDVDSGAWYADAVAAVSEAGIVLGRSPDTFVPDRSITREEMAVMAVRAYEYLQGSKAEAASAAPFSDYSRIHGWAQDAVSTAKQAGLLQGRGNQQFAPQERMTRAESAQVLFNLLAYL